MKVSKAQALSKLVRVRDLGVLIAETRRAEQEGEVRAACLDEEQALGIVENVINARFSSWARSDVDLEYVQALAAIEEIAWEQRQVSARCRARAESALKDAIDAHVSARIAQRVAEQAHERCARQEAEVREKIAFDRVADLFGSSRRTNDDQ